MKTWQFILSLFEALFINKVRTGLAMLGIVIGIAAVITLVSLGESSQKAVESDIQSLGANLLTVIPASRGSDSKLTMQDVSAITNSSLFSRIDNISPEVMGSGTLSYGEKTTNAQIFGVTAAYLHVRNLSLQTGYFISSQDVAAATKVVVLGSQVAEELFGKGTNALGQQVRLNGDIFTVIGIAESKGGNGFFGQDSLAYFPLSTVQKRINGEKTLSTIALSAKDKDDLPQLKQELQIIMSQQHSPDDFRVQSQEDLLKTAQKVTETFSSLLASIAGISLIVGGIGIMNVMLVTVIERTSEIGLRKAVGAKKRTIISQFLGEAVILTSIGGIVGVVVGLLVSTTIFIATNRPFAFSLPSIFLSLIVSSCVGILFGWYPAWKAANLSPIEALRYE